MRIRAPALVLLAGSLCLAGCDTEETLAGRVERAVTESTVAMSSPLIVPPSFSLRPGSEAGHPPAAGGGEGAGTDLSLLDTTSAETSLLLHAGADAAESGIRDTLARENAVLSGNPELVRSLLFGNHPAVPPEVEPVVDTADEDEGFWDWF